MDREIAPRELSARAKTAIGAAALTVPAFLALLFVPARNSQAVDASRLTISTVNRGTFRNFPPLRGRVTPRAQNRALSVDLDFIDSEPADLQRGQTAQLRVTLGNPSPALLLPSGAFLNETGGSWVFVVAPDGRSAVRREVRIGRRNADYLEVLDGLDANERVITSPYTGFAERDRLTLSQ